MTDPVFSDPLPSSAKTLPAERPVTEKKEVLFHGLPASPGICRGRVLVFGAAHTDFNEIDPIPIDPADADAEVEHFQAAVEKTKNEIKSYIEETFGYDLHRTCDEIRPYYQFEESCQGTVPEAIIAFLDSSDFENAVRLAVSLGGDSDTLACITGGIAEAYYKEIPEEIVRQMWQRLPECFREILREMRERFGCPLRDF